MPLEVLKKDYLNLSWKKLKSKYSIDIANFMTPMVVCKLNS
jgi:hypothetical protein